MMSLLLLLIVKALQNNDIYKRRLSPHLDLKYIIFVEI